MSQEVKELRVYEIDVLVKNEIQIMQKYIEECKGYVQGYYIKARCERILAYIEEGIKLND